MSFKVIDGDGPSKEDRDREEKERDLAHKRESAKVEFSWAIRDCAANMLRIIRGAGKPYNLLGQMQEVLRAALEFQEAHGYWPQNIITNDLKIEDKIERERLRLKEGSINQATYDRWWENGEFDLSRAEMRMYQGALQAIASQLIGQKLQQTSGEREFYEGVSDLAKAREELRNSARKEIARAKGHSAQPRKKIDLGPAAKDEKKHPDPVEQPGSQVAETRRSRKFDNKDLKELKKAIKANDTKKIAELKAKLGQRDF
jgi:hypothetical protein